MTDAFAEYTITVRAKLSERLRAVWLLTFGFKNWINPKPPSLGQTTHEKDDDAK